MRILPILRSNSRGFTLVELLVVLVLIAALAGMLMPSFGRSGNLSSAEKLSDEIKDRFIRAQAYAVSSGSTVGMFVSEQQVVWAMLSSPDNTSDEDSVTNGADSLWQTIERPWAEAISLEPENYYWQLQADGSALLLDARLPETIKTPQIVYQPDGETWPPLSLSLVQKPENMLWSLEWDGLHAPEIN